MSDRDSQPVRTGSSRILSAGIFDVDGVLLASPHERAWREALVGLADADRFTTAVYQAHVAGKTRLSGALAALQALDVPDAEHKAAAYAERKQQRLEALIAAGAVLAYPDALRFVEALAALRWPLAVASSSRNATGLLRAIRFGSGTALLDIFTVNVCGRELRQGKPDPEIFLLAAAELQVAPARCLVIEDAAVGIEAGRAGGMATLGIARHGDADLLEAAGAELVVTSLDEVALDELAAGRLCRRPA
jgi:beta-phosphoglucomutase